MLNKTAYLNSLTKEKEIEIYMQSHRSNLKQMKSINHNEPQVNPIEINKNKAKYFQGRRIHEINLQNEILTQKIEKIVNSSRNPKYYSSHEKYSRSLNGHIKRLAQSQVNEENLKLLVRLEESKPTYSTKKYLDEFEHLKQVEKKMSTAEFYLTDSPTFRKRKLNTNKSFMSRRNSSFGQNSSFMGEKSEIVKQTVTLSDGRLWQIKIYKDEKEVKITGEIIVGSNDKESDSNDLKLIAIPNIEANLFLRKHCDNKLNKLIKHLKVDQKDGSLLLIVPQNPKSPSPSKLMNPQEKSNIERKLMNVEISPSIHKRAPPRQIFNTVNKKPLLEELSKQNSEHSEQNAGSKKSEDSILPKINSRKNTANQKQKLEDDSSLTEKKQKLNTKKSSISSIKSTEKVKDAPKAMVEDLNIQTPKKQETKAEQQKDEAEEEKYEEQKFEESMNNKEAENKDTVKAESIKDQHEESGQKIQEIKSKEASIQGQDKIESSMQTPIEESVEKKLQQLEQKMQENEQNKDQDPNLNENPQN